ncbi:MAG: DUF4255 domain-containing protein [Bacteroidota bacterium]
MIHEFIPLIALELREYLDMKFDAPDEVVILSNLVEQDGSIAIREENKVVVSLINVERDGTNQMAGGGLSRGDIPVHVNVYVLFSAYFTNYAEALKFLSGVIGFFQANPTFTIFGDTVRVEMFNLDFKEISNLWAALGAKYIPSVIYRLRTLNMDEGKIRDVLPPISGLTAD